MWVVAANILFMTFSFTFNPNQRYVSDNFKNESNSMSKSNTLFLKPSTMPYTRTKL